MDQLQVMSDDPNLDLDFWMEPRKSAGNVDIMTTSTAHRLMLEEKLSGMGVSCSTMIENVQELIDQERQHYEESKKKVGESSFFEDYHTWEEVHAYIEGLAAKYPNLATVWQVGTTYEGRPMKAITLSTKPNSGKPSLWFDGGLHAREWITVPTVTYIADRLLSEYQPDNYKGNNSTQILDDYDVIICPVLNVDGYDYTWNGDRMWRKTRSPNNGSPCDGTDPNRNWNFHWGEAGTSSMKCSDSYEGPSAASEVEVQAVQNYICEHKDTIKGYINFHAYSQLWMSNWGYTAEKPPDYEAQNDLSAAAVAAIKSVHNKVYDYGPIATTIYPASGSSADYTYGECGVKYSYGVELRDTGEFGFLLPPQEIIPSGEEIFAVVVTMANYIKENP
jgi:murein tripeptide amidase MpaA